MFTSSADGRERHTWLVVLLVLLTLLPAAFVLWFMNEAVQVQTEARRRVALEGYRAQLRLVRSRVEARWDAQAAQLNGTGPPAERFVRLMQDDKGDGAILLDDFGLITFPDRKGRGPGSDTDLERLLTAAKQSEPGPARAQQIATIAAALNDY